MSRPASKKRIRSNAAGWRCRSVMMRQPKGRSACGTARIKATGPERRDDPVLYINGGPGIATVDAIAPHLGESKSMAMLRQGRDVILFDQRGSGRSEVALCPDLARSLNAIAAEGLDPAEEEDKSRAAFARCRAELVQAGEDLDAYTT